MFVFLSIYCLCHNVCAEAALKKPPPYLLAKYACFIVSFLLKRLSLAMLGEGPFLESASRRLIGLQNSVKVELRVVTVTDRSLGGQSTSRQLHWVRPKVHLWQRPHCPLPSHRFGLHGKEQSEPPVPQED